MTVKRKRRAVVFGTEAVEALEEGANLDAVIKWAESGQLEGAVTDLSDQTEDYIRGYTKALEDLEGWNQHEVVDLSEGESEIEIDKEIAELEAEKKSLETYASLIEGSGITDEWAAYRYARVCSDLRSRREQLLESKQ